jgi:hypothetical protein
MSNALLGLNKLVELLQDVVYTTEQPAFAAAGWYAQAVVTAACQYCYYKASGQQRPHCHMLISHLKPEINGPLASAVGQRVTTA